jgi:hypothetical protein
MSRIFHLQVRFPNFILLCICIEIIADSAAKFSLTRRQNEDIVAWFLQRCPDAQPMPISVHTKFPPEAIINTEPFPCIRMDPIRTNTSGLFIAKFKKIKSETTKDDPGTGRGKLS